MKKALFLIILATLLMATLVNAKQLTITPSNINIEYTLGQAQPSTQTLTFVNNDNDTFTLSFSESGTAANYFNISPATYFYPNISGTSKALSISFSIPSTTTPNLYSGSIVYGSGESIPVFINVKQAETSLTINECRIIVPFADYSVPVQRATLPFSETYTFQISNKCYNGLNLDTFRTSGSISTSRGYQPIQLTGGIPSGLYDAGKAGTYTVQFDVSALPEGTYTTYIQMSGINNDTQVTKTVKYEVRVIGALSPITNDTFGTLPSCTVGTNNLVANQTYEFKCTNVNPNLQVNVLPNSFFKGVKVNSESEIYSWTFQPVKLGKTSLEVSFTYKGSPIGEVQNVPLEITTSPVSQASTEMTIEFLKETSNLKDGENLSFLVKDATSKNLITDAEAYLNGIILNSNQFMVSSGQSYRLTVAKAGYNTKEANFSIIKPLISLNLPNIFEIGETITASVSPQDVTWTLSGTKNTGETVQGTTISLPLGGLELGTYTLIANKQGYETASRNFSILPVTTIISDIPEKLKRGSVNALQLSRDVEWEVQLQSKNGSINTIATGVTATINFVPSKGGVYTLYVRSNPLRQWELSEGFSAPSWINWKNVLIIAAVGIGIYVIYRIRKGGSSSDEETEEQPLGLDFGESEDGQ